MNDEELIKSIFFDFNDNVARLSYSELKDESGVCMCCGKELKTVRTRYIHRHDGENEEEYHMTIDANHSTNINEKICCNGCLTQEILDEIK